MAFPLPDQYMTSYYPVSTKTKVEGSSITVSAHWGVDITCPSGTDVYAVLGGRIADIGVSAGSKYVLLETLYGGQQVIVAYEHLSDNSVVAVDDEVAEGQAIGKSGATGDGVVAANLHIGASRGWFGADVSAHRSPSITIFPTDMLWSRAPDTGVSVKPAPTKSEAAIYYESIRGISV